MRLRVAIGFLAVAAASGVLFALVRTNETPKTLAVVAPFAKPDASITLSVEDEDRSPSLHPPTGKLAALSCASAAVIVKEVRDELAFIPSDPTPAEFANATRDWIDPHGHWAVATDATPYSAVEVDAAALMFEISRGTECAAAARIGKKLASWIDSERARYDVRITHGSGDASRALNDALDVAERDSGPSAPLASVLTDELADRAGALKRAYGAPIARYLQNARNRFFPEMSADAWSEVVIAAAVRAWVEQIDAHGAWAPYGEEASVHDVDLDQDAPSRLWSRATRTVLGVRIDDGAIPPLASNDVILEVDGMPLAGLAVEQLDEMSLTATDSNEGFDVVVMRDGDVAPRVVRIEADAPSPASASAHPFDLAVETIPYANGNIAIVTIPDVYDDLGELFARALARVRTPELMGIVLDLRGDGGGSTEGAIDTLGAFLPGAHLFAMKNRRGAIEMDSAPSPPNDERWNGPVATLVDAGTASAAEMLAGALAAYRRGPTVGAPTYGKGCAQEYLDDDAHAGLLRVTTLLFSLPDGSPVQRTGLTPMIAFPFHDADVGDDREAKIAHSPDPWTGPDIRDHAWLSRASQFVWPSANAHIGPCKDESVCKALTLLGEPHARTTASRR